MNLKVAADTNTEKPEGVGKEEEEEEEDIVKGTMRWERKTESGCGGLFVFKRIVKKRLFYDCYLWRSDVMCGR